MCACVRVCVGVDVWAREGVDTCEHIKWDHVGSVHVCKHTSSVY